MKNNMQVMKDSKVNFVSAVGVYILLSGSISGVLTVPGLIVLLFGVGGKPATDFNPVGLRVSCRQRRAGLPIFFLSCGSTTLEAQSRLQFSKVPSFQPTLLEHCAFDTSTLCICTRQMLTIHLVLLPFDGL